MKDKAAVSEEANRRMNDRLSALESEMRKSEDINKRSDKLRNTLMLQPLGRSEPKGQSKEQQDQELQQQEPKDQGERGQEDWEAMDGKIRSSFQSNWAKEMQEELTKVSGNQN